MLIELESKHFFSGKYFFSDLLTTPLLPKLAREDKRMYVIIERCQTSELQNN